MEFRITARKEPQVYRRPLQGFFSASAADSASRAHGVQRRSLGMMKRIGHGPVEAVTGSFEPSKPVVSPPLTTASVALPSVTERAKNFAGAMSRVVHNLAHGETVIVANEMAKERLEICRGCEFFDGFKCKMCGCVMSFKTRLKTEDCPAGKW